MLKRLLNNGYSLPVMAVGTNRMDKQLLVSIISNAFTAGISYFDTARDYGNEHVVGEALSYVLKSNGLKRSDFYITTKVGNGQQLSCNMRKEIDISLKSLQVDYVDLWLLHWPLPDYFINNFKQMHSLMQEGKVRAIGLANPRVRHLEMLKDSLGIIPQVIQIEHHPFRVSRDILNYCKENNIIIQAYSPLCFMIDKLKNNDILKRIAFKYNKSLAQIVLRWHYQHGITPVFRSTNPMRYKENADIFNFEISNEDMEEIFSLDEDYKFIPESLHCYGY